MPRVNFEVERRHRVLWGADGSTLTVSLTDGTVVHYLVSMPVCPPPDYIYIYKYIYIYLLLYIYLYKCLYIYIYSYIYINPKHTLNP